MLLCLLTLICRSFLLVYLALVASRTVNEKGVAHSLVGLSLFVLV